MNRHRVALVQTVPFVLSLVLQIRLAEPLLFAGDELEPVPADGQPLAANVKRLLQALEFLGTPLAQDKTISLQEAAAARNATKIQQLLDPHVLFVVAINPESRVRVARGPAKAVLQQAGFTPVVVKVVNLSTVTKPLRITSPNAGPVYAGVAELSMKRQDQEPLRENENVRGDGDRFLHVEMFTNPPMTANLSGLEVEYAIALVYSSESGKREAGLPVHERNARRPGAGVRPLGQGGTDRLRRVVRRSG